MEEIEINGKKYVPKSSIPAKMAINKKGMSYCIVRTYSAGVFAGYIDRNKTTESGTVYEAIRLWRWEGAFTLSTLATEGTSKPDKCEFAVPIEVDLKNIIEVIPCSEKSRLSILSVKSKV